MEHLSDKIQDYIEGNLTGAELLEFEQYLDIDVDFKNLVMLQSQVHDIINKREHSQEFELRKTLSEVEGNFRKPEKSLFVRLKPLIGVVSAACVLIVGYLFFVRTNTSLYELPNMQSEIVRGQESLSPYEDAVKLYNNKSYTQARDILNELIVKEPGVVQYQYYAALTYVGEERWGEATLKLQDIVNGHSIFKEEAKYYLAVSFDKSGNRKEAIRILETIKTDGELGKKAAKLLKELN